MWLNIFIQICISILTIFVIHHLVIHFKNVFTPHKTKDIIAIHTQKYQDLLQNVQESNEREKTKLITQLTNPVKNDNIDTHNLTETDLHTMNAEMQDFIQTLL